MKAFVLPILAVVVLIIPLSPRARADSPPSRFPAAGNDEAWKLLPREEPPLPAWARVLIEPLPRTTAAMLELDYLHRAKNPLGPVLAGKLRWAAADAIGSDYARRHAETDLRRAGVSDGDLKKLADDPPEADRALIAFARKMTRAAYKVTDEEVAELLKRHGPEKVVAMVHTLAYANFHNRIILALGVEVELGGPLPPVELKLDPEKRTRVPAPERPPWTDLDKKDSSVVVVRPDWSKGASADLEKALDTQKKRKLRIPLPEESRIEALPADARESAKKILWNTVSSGYQPEMTSAWFACLRAYQQEAKPDRVFTNSVFWVVTRSNECFY